MSAPAGDPVRDDYVLQIPTDLRRLNDARRFVCDTIEQWGVAPIADAALLTSEVVSNAMIHGGGHVVVRVRRADDRVLVEVHDASSELPHRVPPDPNRPGGQGLRIVEALAVAWGITEIHDDGKIVWFEVPLLTQT